MSAMDATDGAGNALRRVSELLSRVRSGQEGENATTGDSAARMLDGLTALRELRAELASWEPELIGAARRAGVSWAQLAPALGVASRQAAERRYLRLQPTGGGEATKEARVQATRDRRAGDRAVTAWARENSAELRQLAGQVSALTGLSAAGRREVERVHAELAGNDAATLLGPLADLRAHLVDEHPALAARITDMAAGAHERRHTTLSDRPGRTDRDSRPD